MQCWQSTKPIHDAAKIKRIVFSTYQSTSGWGKEAVDELYTQTKDILAGRKIVTFWTAGTASALDTSRINDGRDIGTANAFLSNVEGKELDFYFDGTLFRDRQTNSVWDYTGYSVSGSLEGKKLELIVGTQHFWFSASAFFPLGE